MTEKPMGLTRREREFRRQRAEILEAALALFSRKGFHRVTMQQIARRAEFSVGKLYKFFANKAERYGSLTEWQRASFVRETPICMPSPWTASPRTCCWPGWTTPVGRR